MSYKKYAVIFDMSNIGDEVEVEDLSLEMEVQPYIGMSVFIDDRIMEIPEELDHDGYFLIEELDYLISDDVWVATMKNQHKY